MSEHVSRSAEIGGVVRWSELAPAPEIHSCDCDYCEVNGELDPIKWPTLVRITINGVEYVSDRHFAIRADLAPIPDDYPGPALTGPTIAPDNGVFSGAAVTSEPPNGVPVLWSTMNALRMTQCVLRVFEHPDTASDHARRSLAIVTATGEHVGWAMASKAPNYDYYEDSCTWDYSDSLASGDLIDPRTSPGLAADQ